MVKDQVQIPDISDGSLLDVEITPSLLNTQINDSEITYSGDLNMNFIFTNDSTINSRSAKIPFECSVDNENRSNDINVDTEISIKESNFEINAKGEVSGKIEMEFLANTTKNESMCIIDNIEVVENKENLDDEDYSSLILYITRPGDTLWKIAKGFNTTVEELVRMNGIQDENKIDVGQKIYIPKFNYVKKEKNENAREQAIV